MVKSIKNKLNTMIKILLVIATLFTSFNYTSVFASEISEDEVKYPTNSIGSFTNEGDVLLTKVVEKTDEEDVYKITLTAKGKEKTVTNQVTKDVYAVVVFDRSGSMENYCDGYGGSIYCSGTYVRKFDNAVNGAKSFANTLLTKIPNAKIALVTFSTNATTSRGFENSNLDNANFGSASGGTNLHAGLLAANTLLSDTSVPTDAHKYVVVISDGEPTYYMDGNEVKGPGSSTNKSVYDNTIAAANTLKSTSRTNAQIFSVGYSLPSGIVYNNMTAQDILTNVATTDTEGSNVRHYVNSDPDAIANTFTNIAQEMSKMPAGTDATITDVIGNNFTYIENTVSPAQAVVDGKTVSLHLDEITESGTTLSFKVKANVDNASDWYDTNESASITYKDTNGNSVEKDIPRSSEVFIPQANYNYVINYYKDSKNEDNKLETITGEDIYNALITVDANKNLPNGYSAIIETKDFNISKNEEENIIDIIYTKKSNLSYTVDYYKDNLDGEKIGTTTVDNQTFGNLIQENQINKNKYMPSFGYNNGVIETTMPYTIIDGQNIIKVCYYKRTDMAYTVKYVDENNKELATEEKRTNKTFEETYTETAKDINGYKLVGNSTQTITIDEDNKTIIFTYTKRNDYKYTVKYVDENNKELVTEEKRTNKTFEETYTETAKDINGYKIVGNPIQTITIDEDNKTIIFTYTKRNDLNYKVNYYKDDELLGSETIEEQIFGNSIDESNIDVNLYMPEKGYKDGVITTTMPITITTGENVINVVYEKKDNLTYRVEYYFDGIIDSSKTEFFEGFVYGTIINNYKDKLPEGYMFVSDTGSLTIDDSSDNVIKVYYESIPMGDIIAPDTGINNNYLYIPYIISTIGLALITRRKQEN